MRLAYISLLGFFLWAAFSWYYYTCRIKGLCASSPSTAAITVPEPAPPSEPLLLYGWKSFKPFVNGTLTSLKDSIITKGLSNQLLQITGYYSPKEVPDYEKYNLGLARASELKKILVPSISENRIEVFSDTLGYFPFFKDSLIEAVTYEWVDGYAPSEPDFFELNHDTKRIKVEDYTSLLNQIANRLKSTEDVVILRGHTDSEGDSELNYSIALRNAKDIRDFFIEKGVERKKITTTSQGEDSPITGNDTEYERRENRRVEIIIKK